MPQHLRHIYGDSRRFCVACEVRQIKKQGCPPLRLDPLIRGVPSITVETRPVHRIAVHRSFATPFALVAQVRAVLRIQKPTATVVQRHSHCRVET